MPEKFNSILPRGTEIPNHVAIILDGNRRWARARGLKPWEGHKAGYEAVKKLAKAARDMGVPTFTIWAFSTENWSRPKEEIDQIMELLKRGLTEFEKEAHKDKVRLIHLGRKDRFPKDLADQIRKMEDATKKYRRNILNLALDYGGRDEILRATQKIVKEGIPADKIDEKVFSSYLDTAGEPNPEPDLFIRTSGEQRTSGLLPWQMTYSEYYFEEVHLPDFTPERLKAAILDYSRRRRRFGGNDTVEHFAFDPATVAKLEIAWWKLRKMPKGTRMRDYVLNHLKKQFGLSTKLAVEAGNYLIEGLVAEDGKKDLVKARAKMNKFYKLIKEELKLAFEPSTLASLQVRLWEDLAKKTDPQMSSEAEKIARELYAEMYRISLFQAAKAASYMVAASLEGNLAEQGLGEEHWKKAEEHLVKFYKALKERVA